MIELLDRVAAEAKVDGNAFFNTNRPDKLRAEIELLPAGPDMRRWYFYDQLAKDELRVGNNAAATDYALKAYAELATFGSQMPHDRVQETILRVGVAYLRQGEVLNCLRMHNADSCILPLRGGGVHADPSGARSSLKYFQELMRRNPKDSWWYIKGRWLANLVHMALGEWPDRVPADYVIPPSTFDSDEPFPRFPEIAGQVGLDAFNLAGGAIADDFDGDGDLDVLTSSSHPEGPMHLFRREADGTFHDVTAEAGLTGLRGGLNMTQTDYDDDGDVDVLVMRGAWLREFGRWPRSLLRNNGDLTFTDVTLDAGLGDLHYPSQGGAWGDYDLDGDLDLFLANEWCPAPAPSQLFRNNGDGTFTDVAAQAGVTNMRFGKAASWGDYDGDRYPDLYVTNLGEPNRLYHNQRDGTFKDVAPALDVELPLASFPAWFWDFDNDGALDIFASGYGGPGLAPDVGFVAASYLGLPTQAERARLYRGNGKGAFEEVGGAMGLTRITHPMGANFGDLDNDGYPDFYLGTGYPMFEGLIPNVMYHNRAGRSFADVTTNGGFGHLQKGHGIAFADLDDDGDQDVYSEVGGMYLGDGFRSALYHNPGFGNHWLKLRVLGTRSNRLGVGARIRARVVEDDRTRDVYKWVNSGASFGGNPLRRIEIGLGRAAKIEELEVYWPTSDTRQVWRDVAVDQFLEIEEGRAEYRILALHPAPFQGPGPRDHSHPAGT